MRIGVTLYAQNYGDWDRYEAHERGEESTSTVDGTVDAQILSDEIGLGLLVEELGFDSLWTIEHHVTPYTMVTNPLQLLTFFAGATSRIDLGTMVVVLPWHHPIRVAEDIIMLQHALRGRKAFIGFGRGAAQREFKQLGIDMNQSRQLFHEGVEIVKLALTEDEFSYHGEIHHFEDVSVRPRPRDAQALLDNLHFSWGSPASAPVGAAHGLKPLIIPQKPLDEYHADLTEFGKARAEIGLEPARPRMHLNIICVEDEQEAYDLAHKHIPEYVDSAAREYELGGQHFKTIKGYEHYARMEVVDRSHIVNGMAKTYLDNHIWGTPAQCLDKIRSLSDRFHPEEFMLVFKYGSMSIETAERSLRLFAEKVLPAAQAIEVLEPIVYTEAAAAQ
ncbi:LLM class flavin-dependent oxidoreductase [Rhodococcoides yunnanense]|uniref:LLM class flavin-dependent oxidoreductase n=1 Tax=Rhodococcoides yunnanense TaxID=278209 RepID=UPI00093308CD|nr:LLM class flavin-dependent oxidoreductase [Rhodococcus yunnanensis]